MLLRLSKRTFDFNSTTKYRYKQMMPVISSQMVGDAALWAVRFISPLSGRINFLFTFPSTAEEQESQNQPFSTVILLKFLPFVSGLRQGNPIDIHNAQICPPSTKAETSTKQFKRYCGRHKCCRDTAHLQERKGSEEAEAPRGAEGATHEDLCEEAKTLG